MGVIVTKNQSFSSINSIISQVIIYMSFVLACPLAIGMNGSNSSNAASVPMQDNRLKINLKTVDVSNGLEGSTKQATNNDEVMRAENYPGINAISNIQRTRKDGFFCSLCKETRYESAVKHQSHLNGHTGQKTFKCRRECCSEHFVTEDARRTHEKNVCTFNNPLIDKSHELINGILLDACQFNALPHSKKFECPICNNHLPSKSYKLHVLRCEKKTAHGSNKLQLNDAQESTAIKLKRCLQCKKIFQLSRFANHVCSEEFPNPHNDNSNKKNITNSMEQAVLPFVCAICKIAMGDKYDFLEHLEKCNPQQMYCCSNKQCFFRKVTEKDFLQQKEARQKAVTMMSDNSLEEPINSLAFNGLSPYETNQLDAEQDPTKLKRKPDGDPDLSDREQAKRLKIDGGNSDE